MDNTNEPAHWSLVQNGDAAATMALDSSNAFNDKLTSSLRLTVTCRFPGDKTAGVANSGYWGIPVHPDTRYRATVIVKADANFSGPMNLSIVSEDGSEVYASEKVYPVKGEWKKLETTLKTGKAGPTAAAHFVITLEHPGTVWLGFVSLFPPTWNDRPNGLRKDLMQMMVDLNPKFPAFSRRQLRGRQYHRRAF